MELVPADSPAQLGPTFVNRALTVSVYADRSTESTSSRSIRGRMSSLGKPVRADHHQLQSGETRLRGADLRCCDGFRL
jgi:hypothetical protein